MEAVASLGSAHTGRPPAFHPAREAARRFACPAALCVIWTAMVIAVNPLGEFPLYDDWAWSLSVKTLCESHALTIPDFPDMSLIAQILWGALTCLPAGFSYTALRIATAAWGLAAVLTTYALCRETGAARGLAFLAALAVAANPLILKASNSFMTDVPFLALVLLAMLCFVRTARSGSRATAVLAVLFALLATLTRQAGLVIPILFFAGCVLGRAVTARNLGAAIVALLVTFGGLRLYEHWLLISGQLSPNYGRQMRFVLDGLLRSSPAALLSTLVDGSLIVGTYVGVFLLAPLIAILPRRLRAAKWRLFIAAAAAAGSARAIDAALVRRGWSMPFNPNFDLTDLGVGPNWLTDVRVERLAHVPQAPAGFWNAVTQTGIAGAALLVFCSVLTGLELLGRATTATGRPGKMTAAMSAGFVGAYGLVLLVVPFDRYFVPIFPMALIAATWGAQLPTRAWVSRLLLAAASTAALLGILLHAGFSIAATHDYLSWNRARWSALNDLTERDGVPPRQIDGGGEFNALHRFGLRSYPYAEKWGEENFVYRITMGPMPGYQTFRRYPYPRWIEPPEGSIFVLVRETTGDGTPK